MTLFPSTAVPHTDAPLTSAPPTPAPSSLGGGVTLHEATSAPASYVPTLSPPRDAPLVLDSIQEAEDLGEGKRIRYYVAIFGAVGAVFVAFGLGAYLYRRHVRKTPTPVNENVPF